MFVLKSFSGRCTLNILAVALYARAAADSFDPNTSPTGEGCVDPKGFTDCFATSANNLVSCGEFCKTQNTLNYNDCILGCGKTQLSRNLGCWIQSCWNQVSSAISLDSRFKDVFLTRTIGLLVRVPTYSNPIFKDE